MLIEKLNHYSQTRPCTSAIAMGDQAISYADLLRRVGSCSHQLRRRGIGPSDLVLIYTERGPDLVTAMLSVAAAGAAYTVVEQDGDQSEHIARIKEIGPKCSIVDGRLLPTFSKAALPALPTDIMHESSDAFGAGRLDQPRGTSIAYVLFTSGSTGRPKGVQITWNNIKHYISSISDVVSVGSGRAFAHVSSFAADLGNTSLFLALATGGTLHVVDEVTRRDPAVLWSYLVRHKVSFVKATPSYWRLLPSQQQHGP